MAILKFGFQVKIIKTGSLEQVVSNQDANVEKEKSNIQTIGDFDKENFLYFRAIFCHLEDDSTWPRSAEGKYSILLNKCASGTPILFKWANGNGDVFPKSEGLKTFATFSGKAVDLNHDQKQLIGKIIDVYPVEEKESGECYIEGLCKIDKKANPQIARQIETGILDSVSLEASVAESMCSICGCIIHTELDKKCEHFEGGLNREYTHEGIKVKCYSINSGIEYTGLGVVNTPADGKAKVLSIISALQQQLEKTSALDVEGRRKIVADLKLVMSQLDEDTNKEVQACVCTIENTKKKEVDTLLKKLSASEYIDLFEHIEKKIAGKTPKLEEVSKKAEEVVKPGVVTPVVVSPVAEVKKEEVVVPVVTPAVEAIKPEVKAEASFKPLFIKKATLGESYWLILNSKDHKPVLKATLKNAFNKEDLVKYEKYITSKVYANNLIKRIEKDGIDKVSELLKGKLEVKSEVSNKEVKGKYECDECGILLNKSMYEKGQGLCPTCIDTIQANKKEVSNKAVQGGTLNMENSITKEIAKPVSKFANMLKARALSRKLAFLKDNLKMNDKAFVKLQNFASKCPDCFEKLYKRAKSGTLVSPTKVSDLPKDASAFDIQDTIIIGDGYTAVKDKEKKEIVVKDKEGKEVGRYVDAFGDDIVSIMKFFQQMLKVNNNQENKPLEDALGPKTEDGTKPNIESAKPEKEEAAPAIPVEDKLTPPTAQPKQAGIPEFSEDGKSAAKKVDKEVEEVVKTEPITDEDKAPKADKEVKDVKDVKEVKKPVEDKKAPVSKDEKSTVKQEIKSVEKDIKSIEKEIKEVKKEVQEIKVDVNVPVKDKKEPEEPKAKSNDGKKSPKDVPVVKPDLEKKIEVELTDITPVEIEDITPVKPGQTIKRSVTDLEAKLEGEKAALEIRLKAEQQRAQVERTMKALAEKTDKINKVVAEMIERDLLIYSEEDKINFQKQGKTLLDSISLANKVAIDKQKADLLKMDNNTLKAFEDSILRLKKSASTKTTGLSLNNVPFNPTNGSADWMSRLPWS